MKQTYEAPVVLVIEMEVQAVLAQSTGATMDATYSEEDM